MKLLPRATRPLATVLTALLAGSSAFAQTVAQSKAAAPDNQNQIISAKSVTVFPNEPKTGGTTEKPILTSVLPKFYDPQDGVSSSDLIRLALENNQEVAAARLDIERARARLRQAGLRPNPTLEVEQTSGRFVGSGGEGELSVGFAIPFEIYGQRRRRVELAEVELTAREAEVRNRERQLTAEVLTNYAEALAALRELQTTENLLELDLQTTRFVQIRVNEGDTPPLELNVLQAEVERLRARRQLAEGQLEASLTRLRLLAGLPFEQPLRLREQVTDAILPPTPTTRETAIEVALRTRPDVALAQIEEQVATAGLRLIRARSRPDVTAYTRYTQGRSRFDDPAGAFSQRDRALTFGIAIGLPVFNKNQGARAEAEIAIRQAQTRREFAERVVRSEVTTAFQRIEAAQRAVTTLETGALPRSTKNVATYRQVYELGEIRITDLITEQRRLLDATRDLTDALTERYRALADLNIALGAAALIPQSQSSPGSAPQTSSPTSPAQSPTQTQPQQPTTPPQTAPDATKPSQE